MSTNEPKQLTVIYTTEYTSDGEMWIVAIGLELHLVAQGKSFADARQRLRDTMARMVEIAKERGEDPFARIKPYPYQEKITLP